MQSGSGKKRIDVHQHILPPGYADWVLRHETPSFPIPQWSKEGAIALMDAVETEIGMLSVSTPGAHLGDDREARAKARELNEYTAGVVAARPDRFGFFATLTLPDVDGALEEAAYAFDVLKADGVILLANSRGAYLGETKFHPLLEELNRRKAVVLVHPNEFPGSGALGFPASMTDFLLDTTRAALSLVSSGAMERFSDLKIILSHAGGFLPYASYRFAPFLGFLHEGGPISEDVALGLMRKFYFDTALSSSPAAMPSLLAFADPTRILFGSDWPFAPVPVARAFAGKLDTYPLDADLRRDIDRRNALALFPRLAD